MVKVGTLQYEISADTRKFQQGMTATQKELRAAKKVFRETEEPAARYGRKVDELDRLHRKGLISSKQYAAALKKEKAALDKVNMTAKDTSKSFGGLGATVKAAALGFVAIGTAQRAFSLLREEMDRIDEIAKTSRFLGIATEQLIGLRHAAEQTAGVSGGQLSVALQRMTRRISEAAAGAGEAQAAIKELGLDAVELNRMGAAGAFKAIADAMQGVRAESDRVRLAFKLFDSEGARLALTLQGGSESLDAYVKSARELGMTFTDQEAENIEAANDAIDSLNKSVSALATAYAVELSPAMQGVSDELQTILKSYQSLRASGWLPGLSDLLEARKPRSLLPGGLRNVTPSVEPPMSAFEKAEMVRAIQEEHAAESRAGIEARHKAFDDRTRAAIANEQLRLEALEGLFNGIKDSVAGKIPDANSFGAESVGEYDFLRDRQRKDQEAAERKRAHDAAQAKRDALIDQMREVRNEIFDLKQKLEPTVGV